MATSTPYTSQASLVQSKAEVEGLQYLDVKKRYGERLVLISGAQLTLNFVEKRFKSGK
jgi:hypothetical protein